MQPRIYHKPTKHAAMAIAYTMTIVNAEFPVRRKLSLTTWGILSTMEMSYLTSLLSILNDVICVLKDLLLTLIRLCKTNLTDM